MTSSSLFIETAHSVWFGAQAWLATDDKRELAWAEKHVLDNPAYKWILGRYVMADEPNNNGHVFPLDDLRAAQQTLVHAPLNMIHRPQSIVGCYVASDLIYPTTAPDNAADGQPMDVVRAPYMEALAAFYHYYFRPEYEQIARAYSEGALFYSMEAVPESLTCLHEGCGQIFAYAGRQHPSYCAHLQEPLAVRRLNKPHFTGGALIVPPVRPGWNRADITQVAELIRHYSEEAEMAYDHIAEATPHLDARQWEAMMGDLLATVHAADGKGPDLKKVHDQNKNKPHPYKALQGDGGKSSDAPCVKCGKGAGAPVHNGGMKDELDASAPIMSAYGDYELYYEIARDFTKAKRDELAKKGWALPDGSYPIETTGDLKNAIRLAGSGDASKGQVIAHIKKNAARLGATDLLPPEWKGT
jgi:hypothetical protein